MKSLFLNLFLSVFLFLSFSCYNLDNELEDKNAKGATNIINNNDNNESSVYNYGGNAVTIQSANIFINSSVSNSYAFNLIDGNLLSPKILSFTLDFPLTSEIDGEYNFDISSNRRIELAYYNANITFNDDLVSGTIKVTKLSDTKFTLVIDCITESGKKVDANITREFTKLN